MLQLCVSAQCVSYEMIIGPQVSDPSGLHPLSIVGQQVLHECRSLFDLKVQQPCQESDSRSHVHTLSLVSRQVSQSLLLPSITASALLVDARARGITQSVHTSLLQLPVVACAREALKDAHKKHATALQERRR